MKLGVFDENRMSDDQRQTHILLDHRLHQGAILSTHSIFRWTAHYGLGSNSVRVRTKQKRALVELRIRRFDGTVLPGHSFREVTR